MNFRSSSNQNPQAKLCLISKATLRRLQAGEHLEHCWANGLYDMGEPALANDAKMAGLNFHRGVLIATTVLVSAACCDMLAAGGLPTEVGGQDFTVNQNTY